MSNSLCEPMDYSPPGSFIHGFSQARMLEWVAISFSGGSSQPRDRTCVLFIGRQILYHWAIREAWATVTSSFLKKYKFIYFNWRLITLQYCIGFAIHQHESAMGVHAPNRYAVFLFAYSTLLLLKKKKKRSDDSLYDFGRPFNFLGLRLFTCKICHRVTVNIN